MDASRLTGRLLARARDPDSLRAHPDVARLEVLVGRGDVVSIEPRPGVSSVDLANALHGEAGIAWAHPDVRLPLVPHEIPDDPLLSAQWHLVNDGQRGFVRGVDVNAEEAWAITAGAGVRVAVLDSGTDVDHPDLIVLEGRDYVDDDDRSDPDDGNNHGTAAAGLIAAIGNNGIGMAGVAWEAEIYGIRILARDGELGGATVQEIYEAFVEAVDNGADVLNNSWGIGGGYACDAVSIVGALEDAFDYAEAEGRGGLGAVNVFSAGNDGCDTTGYGIVAHPAVIGVAAVDGFDRLTPYSNFGPGIDVAAPSDNIATLDLVGDDGGDTNLDGDPDYTGSFGGTSAAAPMVSGVAALMVAANPRITAAEVRRTLCETAVRVDPQGADYDEVGRSLAYGCGRVDAGAAVRAVANLGPPDAPTIAERATTFTDDVVLTWPAAADPDDDVLRYRLRWALASSPEDETVELVEGTRFDLTGAAGGAPTRIRWRVRALDPWGPGDWSITQELTVEPAPEPTGCASVPGTELIGVSGLAGLLARRRRERRPGRHGT